MDTNNIAYRVAEAHNTLAKAIANGIDLASADNVILVGNALSALRAVVTDLTCAPEQDAEEYME